MVVVAADDHEVDVADQGSDGLAIGDLAPGGDGVWLHRQEPTRPRRHGAAELPVDGVEIRCRNGTNGCDRETRRVALLVV